MSEFKVGDRVRIKKNDIVGCIREVTILERRSCDLNLIYYELEFVYAVISENRVYVNLKEEDLELIENFKEPTSIEDLEQRIEKLEKCVMGEQNLLEKCENVSSISEFTKEEIEAFNYWKDENYKWACKDETGSIHIFEIKPTIYNIEELLKGENKE